MTDFETFQSAGEVRAGGRALFSSAIPLRLADAPVMGQREEEHP